MVDQAGISRPKPRVRLRRTPKGFKMPIRRLPDVVAGLITALGIVYFFILRMGWSRGGPPIFGNLAEHLLPSEKESAVFFITWIGSMIWLLVRDKA